MKEAILAILLSFPVSPRDQMPETVEARTERLSVVARAINDTADRAVCHEQPAPCRRIVGDRFIAAAMLITQARRESAYRLDVQLGKCRPAECDRGRAKGLWQIHRAPVETVEQWERYASVDLDGVKSAAWRTLTLWAGGAYSAGAWRPHCGFARLAGYGICWSDYGHDRAAEMARVATKLRRLVHD